MYKRHVPNTSTFFSCKGGVDSMPVTNYHDGEGGEYTNCFYSLSLILWRLEVLLTNCRNSSICAVISLVTVTISGWRKVWYKDNKPFYHRIIPNNTMRLKSCLAESMGFKISNCASGHTKVQTSLMPVFQEGDSVEKRAWLNHLSVLLSH